MSLVSFLNGFFQLILDIVIFLVNLILLPIDALIYSFFPTFVDITSYITNMLQFAMTYLNYVLDSFGLEPFTILFLVNFLIFKITVPLQIWVVKIAISWYDNLKV